MEPRPDAFLSWLDSLSILAAQEGCGEAMYYFDVYESIGYNLDD
jgi:hypothetical protein